MVAKWFVGDDRFDDAAHYLTAPSFRELIHEVDLADEDYWSKCLLH